MKNDNLISYKQYIIDTEGRTYKAVWDCQVAGENDCLFYEAETGRVQAGEDEVEFVCEHHHKVTKHEFLAHKSQAAGLTEVNEDELKQSFNYRQVI
jgi:hypothetical protein